MTFLELGKRLCPLTSMAEEETEAAHLKFLAQQPPGWTFAEAVSRFNANVSYSGLAHAVTQDVSYILFYNRNVFHSIFFFFVSAPVRPK